MKYLLPCACGESFPVSRSQSGLEVACPHCGESQVVPKLAQLNRLPQVPEESPSQRSRWGAPQITTFIGGTIFCAGLAFALVAWLTLGPSPMEEMRRLYGPMPENLSPEESILVWRMILQEGLDARYPVPRGAYDFESYYSAWKGRRNWIWIWLVVAGVGAVVAGIGISLGRAKPPRRIPSAATPKSA